MDDATIICLPHPDGIADVEFSGKGLRNNKGVCSGSDVIPMALFVLQGVLVICSIVYHCVLSLSCCVK